MKSFRWNVVFRVGVILILSLALAWVLVNRQWFFTPLVLSMLLAISTYSLIQYTERTTRDLTQFLISIKQGGFTNVFTGKKRGKIQAGLNSAFNDIINEFQRISAEKESQYLYLQTLNENIGVSIISYSSNNQVEFMNAAAKVLLKKVHMKSINDLEEIDANLLFNIKEMSSGQRRVIKTFLHGEMQQLSIQVKDFVLNNTDFRLLLLQNINSELEQKEVEAWQKLISVLTHEIMNSVTPIVSLSTALDQMLKEPKVASSLAKDDHEDILKSIETIETRSKGLLHFVNAYKSVSRVPEVNVSPVSIKTMLERIVNLLQPDLDNAQIDLQLNIENVKVNADHDLLEQVIINLVKNAIEALDAIDNAKIELIAKRTFANTVKIVITDNGSGISPDVLDKIFIPFYTTKRSGTGVGLSFARQIMKLHNGNLSVKSEEGVGTTFVLTF